MALSKDESMHWKALRESLSGVGGSVFSSCVCHPIDMVKIRMQVPGHKYTGPLHAMGSIVKEEGPWVLYRGLNAEIVKSGLQNGIYFYCYVALKQLAISHIRATRKKPTLQRCGTCSSKHVHHNPLNTPTKLDEKADDAPVEIPVIVNLFLGCLAGAITMAFLTPINVIQTRIMTSKAKNMSTSIVGMGMAIAKEEGISALWKGLIPSLILTTNPAIQHLVFDKLKTLVLNSNKDKKPSAFHMFLVGAVAKIAATIVTYPYIMAKVRLQIKTAKQEQYNGTLDVMWKILQKEGFTGLYQGLRPQLLKSVLSAALLFMAKEQLLAVTERLLYFLYRLLVAKEPFQLSAELQKLFAPAPSKKQLKDAPKDAPKETKSI